jgi:hypothetical protein
MTQETGRGVGIGLGDCSCAGSGVEHPNGQADDQKTQSNPGYRESFSPSLRQLSEGDRPYRSLDVCQRSRIFKVEHQVFESVPKLGEIDNGHAVFAVGKGPWRTPGVTRNPARLEDESPGTI